MGKKRSPSENVVALHPDWDAAELSHRDSLENNPEYAMRYYTRKLAMTAMNMPFFMQETDKVATAEDFKKLQHYLSIAKAKFEEVNNG